MRKLEGANPLKNQGKIEHSEAAQALKKNFLESNHAGGLTGVLARVQSGSTRRVTLSPTLAEVMQQGRPRFTSGVVAIYLLKESACGQGRH